jgi:hypothetical protein
MSFQAFEGGAFFIGPLSIFDVWRAVVLFSNLLFKVDVSLNTTKFYFI